MTAFDTLQALDSRLVGASKIREEMASTSALRATETRVAVAFDIWIGRLPRAEISRMHGCILGA
jgi:hypothetical protein